MKRKDSQTEGTCGCQWEGTVGRVEWEFGVSRYKVLYTEWINNKVLLCSTGNSIQYPEINHNGKECKKEDVSVCVCTHIYIYIYIYIYTYNPNQCCLSEINTTL